jgi:hypothetical protein
VVVVQRVLLAAVAPANPADGEGAGRPGHPAAADAGVSQPGMALATLLRELVDGDCEGGWLVVDLVTNAAASPVDRHRQRQLRHRHELRRNTPITLYPLFQYQTW